MPKLAKSRVLQLLSVLENPPERKMEMNEKINKFNLNQRFQLKNITFKYEKNTPLVLDNINLTVNKGEKLEL